MHHRHPRTAARTLAIALIAASIAAACVATACSGGKKNAASPTAANSTDTATAIPVGTPTTAPADKKLADKLRDDGDFEGAINVYASIASQKDGDERQDARIAQAQLLTKTGRQPEAKPVLESYVADAGATADGSSAQYMLASALDDLGDTQGAIDTYTKYIAANGLLTDVAKLERAKLLARLGRVPEAEAAGEEVMASTKLLPQFKDSFVFSLASAFEQGHADQDAIAWYDRAKTSGGDVASALARTGAIRKRLNDPAWVDDYRTAVVGYPDSGVAKDLLDALDKAGATVPDYTRGVVDYRSAQNADARAALLRAVAAGDHPAEATYYLAALDERANANTAAIDGYQRAHDVDPASPFADDALWWRGRLLEQSGRYDEASATFMALALEYPTSSFASDAEFHRSLALYRAGKHGDAATAWASVASTASGDDALRARFWEARAMLGSGDTTGADAAFKQLQSDAPDNFYGLRAEVLLKKNDAKDHKPNLDAKKIDWDKIADYLKDVKGEDPRIATIAADGATAWAVAGELRTVGLTSQSDAVARVALKADALNSTALYTDAKAASDAGDVSLAARAATTLIEGVKDASKQPPADLYRVAYPLAYADLVGASSKDESISPTLLLALVRQESFYEADAGSTAGALGLTQVVPTTGTTIAESLGVTDFKAEDLYRPKVSLQFGANFLSGVLQQFKGNPYQALAAYNGGPGTASSALRSSGDDEDLFVEELEFDETRLYVRVVMENYARYRQLYEGIDHPSLPQ